MAEAPTGKDVTIEFTMNGAPIRVNDQVTRFTARKIVDEPETKVLGQDGRKLDQIFVGWEGSCEVPAEGPGADELSDAIDAANELRVPYVINISEKTIYRDGQRKAYVYPDVQITFEKEVRRGEKVMHRWSWKNGKKRIPA